jgi:hypothetical protein
MNRNQIASAAIVFLALGVAFYAWPRNSEHPKVRLIVVRRTIEQGKPVVFFRLELADKRRIQIDKVKRVLFGGASDSPYEPSVQAANSFWAPSQSSPLNDPSKGRDTFGVLEPPNAESWKLRAWVSIVTPNQNKGIKGMRKIWWLARSRGKPFFETARLAWRLWLSVPSEIVENQMIVSSPITNAFTPEDSTRVTHDLSGK